MIRLCAIIDHPRLEYAQAIKELIVSVCVAQAIRHMLRIVSPKYSGACTRVELDEMTEEQLHLAIMINYVFARVTPEYKIQVAKVLQSKKLICSMTGDRVNDAPSLKAANMGIAIALEGTDVVYKASEMILADNIFTIIIYTVCKVVPHRITCVKCYWLILLLTMLRV